MYMTCRRLSTGGPDIEYWGKINVSKTADHVFACKIISETVAEICLSHAAQGVT